MRKMNETELIQLIGSFGIPLKYIEQSNVYSYGNDHYGDTSNGSYTKTRGIRLSTRGKFSKHYLKTGFVTDSGIESSNNSNIRIELVTIYGDGSFIDLVLLDGVHDYKTTDVMKSVFIELQKWYKVVNISHTFNGGSPITTTTFTLKYSG